LENTVADEVPKTDVAKSTSPFDVRTVKSLVALMAQHDLAEIDLRDGTQRLRLRRGQQGPIMVAAHPALPPAHAVPANPPPAASSNSKPDSSPVPIASSPAKKLIEIKSATVGTFYSSPNPDSPPFVRVGSKVSPETVVCIVEAMKLMNEVTADCSGTIAEILVANEQAVDYGQVLFRVDPAA
jgi:acetyl-CoA carboxylase biotin carboxyl carrier protein